MTREEFFKNYDAIVEFQRLVLERKFDEDGEIVAPHFHITKRHGFAELKFSMEQQPA